MRNENPRVMAPNTGPAPTRNWSARAQGADEREGGGNHDGDRGDMITLTGGMNPTEGWGKERGHREREEQGALQRKCRADVGVTGFD